MSYFRTRRIFYKAELCAERFFSTVFAISAKGYLPDVSARLRTVSYFLARRTLRLVFPSFCAHSYYKNVALKRVQTFWSPFYSLKIKNAHVVLFCAPPQRLRKNILNAALEILPKVEPGCALSALCALSFQRYATPSPPHPSAHLKPG